MNWVNKVIKFLALLIIFVGVVFFLGPRMSYEDVNNIPLEKDMSIDTLDHWIQQKNSRIPNIKPDNASHFIWIDSLQKTNYSFVYLHGYSASHGEGQPIISNLADRYKANTYLPRLPKHGLKDKDAFKDLNPKELVEAAKEAIAIGKSIGDTLVIMATSTGATLASYLASADSEIFGLILTAPNFDLKDGKSQVAVQPWGRQIVKQMMGGNYRSWDGNDEVKKYWTTHNRIEGLICLRDLLNQTMTKSTFENIEIPIYIAYNPHDKIISIDKIKEVQDIISQSNANLVYDTFANAPGHVITSSIMNPQWQEVQDSIFMFCDNVLGLENKIESRLVDMSEADAEIYN